jgi:hypothetical protein
MLYIPDVSTVVLMKRNRIGKEPDRIKAKELRGKLWRFRDKNATDSG